MPVRVVSEATEWPLEPDRPPRAGITRLRHIGHERACHRGRVMAIRRRFAAGSDDGHWAVGALPNESLSKCRRRLPSRRRQTTTSSRAVRVSCRSPASRMPRSGTWRDVISPGSIRACRRFRRIERRPLHCSRTWRGRPAWVEAISIVARLPWCSTTRRHCGSLSPRSRRPGSRTRWNRRLARQARSRSPTPGRATSGRAWVKRCMRASRWSARCSIRCDEVLRESRGASLLDTIFGRPGSAESLDDPQWERPAIYALECALTALWSSVGVQPSMRARARARGACGLHRPPACSAWRTACDWPRPWAIPTAALEGVAIAPPSLTLRSTAHRAAWLGPMKSLDTEYWRHHAANGSRGHRRRRRRRSRRQASMSWSWSARTRRWRRC